MLDRVLGPRCDVASPMILHGKPGGSPTSWIEPRPTMRTTSRWRAFLACRLITLDARLRRGTTRLGFVIGPTELDST